MFIRLFMSWQCQNTDYASHTNHIINEYRFWVCWLLFRCTVVPLRHESVDNIRDFISRRFFFAWRGVQFVIWMCQVFQLWTVKPIYNHSDLGNVAFHVALVLDQRCGDRYGDNNNANYILSSKWYVRWLRRRPDKLRTSSSVYRYLNCLRVEFNQFCASLCICNFRLGIKKESQVFFMCFSGEPNQMLSSIIPIWHF